MSCKCEHEGDLIPITNICRDLYVPGLYVCPDLMIQQALSTTDGQVHGSKTQCPLHQDRLYREITPSAAKSKDSGFTQAIATKIALTSVPYRTSPPYRSTTKHFSRGPIWQEYHEWCLKHTCYSPGFLRNHTCQKRSNDTNRAPGGVIKQGQRRTPEKVFECLMCFDRNDTAQWVARHCIGVADHAAMHFTAAMATLTGITLMICFIYLCKYSHRWRARRKATRSVTAKLQETAPSTVPQPQRHVSFLES